MPIPAEPSGRHDNGPIRTGIVHGLSRIFCFLAAAGLLALSMALWTGSALAPGGDALVVMKLGVCALAVGTGVLLLRLSRPVPLLFTSQQNV